MTQPLKAYHLRIYAGPLMGRTLRVVARDELDAAGIVGRALGEHAMDTGPAIYAPAGTADLFGDAQQMGTITLDEALEALKA